MTVPDGWSVTREPRKRTSLDDPDTAYVDGFNWVVRDPDGTTISEWPTSWKDSAVAHARALAARAAARAAGEQAPPWAPPPMNPSLLLWVKR